VGFIIGMGPKIRNLFVLALLVALCSSFALADGSMHIYNKDLQRWSLTPEQRQLAAINFEGGTENLILAIEPGDLKGEKAVWIFPIPADSRNVKVEILKEFPNLRTDYDIYSRKNSALGGLFLLSAASQAFTWPPLILSTLFLGTVGMVGSSERDAALIQGTKGYIAIVYEHIEDMGLTTEVVSVHEASDFRNYAAAKGLDLPPESLATLSEYIGKNYAFVVSWVSDVNEFNSLQSQRGMQGSRIPIGVMASFPSERMYFPLRLTSVYGESEIPLVLYVMGHVTPQLYSGIDGGNASVRYFSLDRYNPSAGLSGFFNGKTATAKADYTILRINTAAKNFTDDLWIDATVPQKVSGALFALHNSGIIVLVFFLLVSVLASVIAAAIAFRSAKPDLGRFALLGLANILTFIGLAAIAYALNAGEKFSSIKNEGKKKDFFAVLPISALLALAISALPAFLFMLLTITSFQIEIFFGVVFFWLLLSVLMVILLLPFAWGFYNQRKTFGYLALFTVIFTLGNIAAAMAAYALF